MAVCGPEVPIYCVICAMRSRDLFSSALFSSLSVLSSSYLNQQGLVQQHPPTHVLSSVQFHVYLFIPTLKALLLGDKKLSETSSQGGLRAMRKRLRYLQVEYRAEGSRAHEACWSVSLARVPHWLERLPETWLNLQGRGQACQLNTKWAVAR